MNLNYVFKLDMVLDNEKFHKLLDRCNNQTEYLDDNKYVDQTLSSKGIIVTYYAKQYKKKIQLTVNPSVMLDDGEIASDKLIHKLEKRIHDYWGLKYNLNDFDLKEMILTADIAVGNQEKVSAYIKVLQRIGKVKGFSPSYDEYFDESSSFCLDGNSNGISFLIYNLRKVLVERLKVVDVNRKKMKYLIKDSEGILRAEVRLTEPKAIRACTNKADTCKQIAVLLENSRDIFLAIMIRVIPLGDFHKKDMAVEIIQTKVKDMALRRRMLRLIALIPEKKSLLLAQKALNYRRIDDIMKTFAEINMSPITISKRHDVKHLKCLYSYLFDEN